MSQSKQSPKLTDTMLVILSHASQQDGSILPLPRSLKANKGAITRTLNALLNKKLIAERPAKNGDHVWKAVNDRSRTLIMTKQGQTAIEGIEIAPSSSKDHAAANTTATSGKGQPCTPQFRTGSKLEMLIAALSSAKGATIAELCEQLEWQSHSVRAALSTIRHKHHTMIDRHADNDRGFVYRITGKADAA